VLEDEVEAEGDGSIIWRQSYSTFLSWTDSRKINSLEQDLPVKYLTLSSSAAERLTVSVNATIYQYWPQVFEAEIQATKLQILADTVDCQNSQSSTGRNFIFY
jgi:hypothetical protein